MQTKNSSVWYDFPILSILFLLVIFFVSYIKVIDAQPLTLKDMVAYEKQGNFIKGDTAQPQRIDMEENSTTTSQIALQIEKENHVRSSTAIPGQYTVKVRATGFENNNNNSAVSLLYPLQINLDIQPPSSSTQLLLQQSYPNVLFDFSSLRGIFRFLALVAAIGLIAYLVYRRIKKASNIKQ